jgi:hypothetical protein
MNELHRQMALTPMAAMKYASASESDHTDSSESVQFTKFESSATSSKANQKSRFTIHRGVVLMLCSQLFTASMHLGARLLETEGDKSNRIHPLEVLFARQSIASIICAAYLWLAKIPDAPFGQRSIRPLLVIRGVAGFFGRKSLNNHLSP